MVENGLKSEEAEHADWKAPRENSGHFSNGTKINESEERLEANKRLEEEHSQQEIAKIRAQIEEIPDSPDNYSSGTRLVKGTEQAANDPDKYIGRGAEKTVYEHPSDPDKVVARYHVKPDVEYMKQQYYLNKFLHLLLPKNIPDVHLAVTDPPLLVSDKIKQPAKINPVSAYLKRTFGRIALRRKLNKLDVFIDGNDCNLIFDQDGSLNYVDSPEGGSDIPKLRKEATKRLKGEDLGKALQYLDRLEMWKQRRMDFKP